MRALGILILFGLVATLLAYVGGHVSPARGTSDAGRHRANPFFWFVGSVTVLVGLSMLVGGAISLSDVEDQFYGSGPEDSADAASIFTWGAVVLVNGVYVWRGARRRGLHDRVGRLFIIVGYVLLGVAMSRGIHISVEVWGTTTSGESNEILTRAMVNFLGWGVPAALLVRLGTWIAPEKILLTAQAGINV